MKLKIIQEKDNWNEFIKENDGSFLQSFEWGQLQEKFFHKVSRWEISENGRKVLQSQMIKEKIVFFNYFYIPYGPVFDKSATLEEKKQAFKLLLNEVQKKAEEEGAVFLKIEPLAPLPQVSNFKPVISSKRIQPQRTIILNIDRTEQEILKSLNRKIRYNIRLAIKKGVRIKISDEYLPIFYNLLEKTKKRQNFNIYPESHYKAIFAVANSDFKAKMLLAEYRKKIILAEINIFFGKRATDLHSGFDYEYRSLKPSELMNCQCILIAKQLGCKEYDFWGIDEKKFPGVTSFKKGFSGQETEYPMALDFIFNKKLYKSYTFLRKLKHIFSRD